MWTSSGTEAVLLHAVPEKFRLLFVSFGLSAECDKRSHLTEIQKSALRRRDAADQRKGGCASEPSAAPFRKSSGWSWSALDFLQSATKSHTRQKFRSRPCGGSTPWSRAKAAVRRSQVPLRANAGLSLLHCARATAAPCELHTFARAVCVQKPCCPRAAGPPQAQARHSACSAATGCA